MALFDPPAPPVQVLAPLFEDGYGRPTIRQMANTRKGEIVPTTTTVRVAGEEIGLTWQPDAEWYYGCLSNGSVLKVGLDIDTGSGFRVSISGPRGEHVYSLSIHPDPQAATDAAVAEAVRFAEMLAGSP